MPVVEAHPPQGPPRKGVECDARRLLRKHGRVEADVSLQHTCVALALVGAGGAKVHGSGNVGGAAVVLAAAVHEQQCGGVDGGACACFCAVVDDGAVAVGALGGGVGGVVRSYCWCDATWLLETNTSQH